MATSSTTLVASSRVASSLFGVMETNYWSRLSEVERNSCFGDVSHLVCQDKTAWNIAGCLEQHWRLDLSVKVAEICNNPNNLRRIYRRHRHRPNVVTDMYLFGYIGRQSEAFPAIVVMSANGSIAKRLASLLSCHESLRLPGFEVLHHEVKVDLLVGKGEKHDRPPAVSFNLNSSTSGELGRNALDDTATIYRTAYTSLRANETERSGLPFRASSRLTSSASQPSTPQSTYRTRSSNFDLSGLRSGNIKSNLNPWIPQPDESSLRAKSSITLGNQSLCGSRVVTSALPSDPSSSWHQCTIGGIILLGGKLYGMTVAHPFLEPAAFPGYDSSSSSLPSNDSGQDEDFESDSQDDGEGQMHTRPSFSHSSFGIYLEDFESPKQMMYNHPLPEPYLQTLHSQPMSPQYSPKQNQSFPTAASFSRLGSTSVLSTIGTFTADQSFASKYWSSELDWALLEITEPRFMSPNLVSTTHGVITPSSVKKRQDLTEARVVVASGVSGIIYTKVYSTVAQVILPSSTKMHEVWKIDCVCAPGDCGAWVICPDTGTIYGIVVAAAPGLRLTYVLPAELVFEDLMARWNIDLSQTQDLFRFEQKQPLWQPSLPSEPVHFGLQSGDFTIPARHTRDIPPVFNPPIVPSRHNRDDFGYGGLAYQSSRHIKEDSSYGSMPYQSPVSSPLAPTGRPIGEALKQTVSAQDPTQSCLSQLSQLFAQIKNTGFVECKIFIENQPRILQEDANLFLREAVHAHRRGDNNYALSCVHRGLLIRKCSYRTQEERVRFLENLASGKKSTVSDFLDDLDDSFEAMISKADQLEPPEATSRAQPVPFQSTRQADASLQVLTMRQSSSYQHGGADQLGPLTPFGDPPMGQKSAQKSPQDHFMAPTREDYLADLTATRALQNSRSGQGSRDSTQSEIEIKGTAGDTDYLDSRFRRQQDPVAFFVIGKVFAILWHENVGLSNKEPGPEVERVNTLRDNNPIGKYGERIFSHIRRMVVVRRRYGYCWCIAINTYSGKGGSYKRISTEEERSHTIVYDCTKKPQLVAGERGFNKEPIAVTMTPPETLHVASRLNYAKVHTVEHNVKVIDVGMVHPSSMPYFKAHWENEVREK